MTRFRDRAEAGRALAERLEAYGPDAIVLGLPRGGVPVAFEVARALGATLDVLVVRKLGAPGQPELAMGAIASGGVRVLNADVIRDLRVRDADLERVAERERRELERRERRYRGDRPSPEVGGRTAILVDDGLATGATMRAAVRALRARRPGRIVVAAPTGAPETCAALRDEADDVVCLSTPTPFHGVGRWYERFPQTTDDEVTERLERAREGRGADAPRDAEGRGVK